MVVRRSDARRRRLVVEPAVHEDDAAVADVASAKKTKCKKKDAPAPNQSRAYSYGADRRNQLKTTDLIPKRFLSFSLVVMFLLLAVWLINVGATKSNQWQPQIGSVGVEAFAIRGQGSLASWFRSFLLIVTGMASIQIYALRQHRCDDYRGTYRLWLWMAALFLLGSVSCIVDVAAIGRNLVGSLTNISLSQPPWMLIAIKLSTLSLLVARGLYEVRESRGSLALVLFVWIAYSAATMLQLPVARQMTVSLDAEMVAGNGMLFGTVALFLAHLTYARFVYMRAHGLIRLNVQESKQTETKKAAKRKRATETKATKKKAKPSSESSVNKTAAAKKKTTAKAPATKQKQAAANAKKTASTKSASQKRTIKGGTSSRAGEQSPQEVLKALADASRAKAKSQPAATSSEDSQDLDQPQGIIKMTKSQRRKQRKLEKQRRRAA